MIYFLISLYLIECKVLLLFYINCNLFCHTACVGVQFSTFLSPRDLGNQIQVSPVILGSLRLWYLIPSSKTLFFFSTTKSFYCITKTKNKLKPDLRVYPDQLVPKNMRPL